MNHFTLPERETVINANDDDDLVRIWTAQPRYIHRCRKDSAFTEIDSGFYGTSEWAMFTIPADRWSPTGVKRHRRMTEEHKQANAARLRARLVDGNEPSSIPVGESAQ